MNVDLFEFLEKLIPDSSIEVSEKPLFHLEFWDSDQDIFYSRITVFKHHKAGVWYKFSDKPYKEIAKWALENGEFVVKKIIPPTRSMVTSRRNPLAIIQVKNPND